MTKHSIIAATWIALSIAFIGCSKPNTPTPPVAIGTEETVVFKGYAGDELRYELTAEQAALFIGLINSPPSNTAVTKTATEGPCDFIVAGRKYTFLGQSIRYTDPTGNQFSWQHPFFDALWLPPANDELPAFFETMKNYDWPE